MFDFCGIGNACVDIVARIDDEFLSSWEFPKSICTYLHLDRADALEAALPSPCYIPGGCGANTASTVTSLGGKAAFLGRVANDAIGGRFLEDMKARSIHYTGTPDTTPGAGSTRIFALITPDTERTFAAYYGVQENLSEQDLDEQSITQSKFMYLDGYALNSRRGGETFLKAAHISQKAGNRVTFSPSDLSILRKYPDVVKALMEVSDGIVCNANEAMCITGEDSAEKAAASLSRMFGFGAMTMSEKGVAAFEKGKVFTIPAGITPGPVTDANGAGDAFAGGFLYALAQGMSMEKAAKLGNRCAASIITHAGARPALDCKNFLTDL